MPLCASTSSPRPGAAQEFGLALRHRQVGGRIDGNRCRGSRRRGSGDAGDLAFELARDHVAEATRQAGHLVRELGVEHFVAELGTRVLEHPGRQGRLAHALHQLLQEQRLELLRGFAHHRLRVARGIRPQRVERRASSPGNGRWRSSRGGFLEDHLDWRPAPAARRSPCRIASRSARRAERVESLTTRRFARRHLDQRAGRRVIVMSPSR
jgi:hypothetical protein